MIWRIKPNEPDEAHAETKHGTFVIKLVRGHGTQRFRLTGERKRIACSEWDDTPPINKSFPDLESAKCAAWAFNNDWSEG